MPDKKALVVEGGALRSVFSAGLLDGFIEQDFNPFNICIGVSAGASNLLFYLTGQPGKSFRIYQEIAAQNQFIDYGRFIKGGHLLDMDWLFDHIDIRQNPDIEISKIKYKLFITMTDVFTGRAVYANPFSYNDLTDALKASMSLPLFYRGFPSFRGKSMTDGGVADGIPIAQAIRMGANKIMVIRSRHKDYIKTDTLWHRFMRWKLRKHPALVNAMRHRILIHENTRKLICKPPPGITIIDIETPQHLNLGRFNRNNNTLTHAYQTGRDSSAQAIQLWRTG